MLARPAKPQLFDDFSPTTSWYPLDLPTEAEQAEKEPKGFLQCHAPPVIVDEVQYAPGFFRYLKAAVDADRIKLSLHNGQAA